ncbi:ModE family transcriptional regulator [Siculibacillus lacustris]|uniref:ModE family transcriptional regulator n=1 Tax=Siculibacillus lacustris TaxID=1549641 RepID=A0A4V6MZ10_9HYPH|nr:ModE family transcriptional regulator [Siculibacillus lacustris]TBW35832.1 ModE family transcriptional regulator [Siculibacillus lacustris]
MSDRDDDLPAGAGLSVAVGLPNGGRFDADDVVLIETIRATRSILGASRLCGHSYRKTWLMVDALNRTFEARVVATFPGRRGAGAEVTPFGERLVALYRSIERRSRQAAAAALAELSASADPGFVPAARPAAPAAAANPPGPRRSSKPKSPPT